MHGVIAHQHLYQPPREDPWLEVVRAEPSATPDHNWNARIDRECYARLGAAETHRKDARASARDSEARAGISRIVNLYSWCSFDVGATLCEWLDSEAPETLRAMQEGDAASVRRWGHGNAIAAPYHHVILPLASPRERRTEIRWGLRDFRRRFGRDAEGIWLPECAADEDTLDAVAAEGVRFTILAPYQVQGHDGRGMPVRWEGAAGRSLVIVPYDGSLAGDVAFGGLLSDPAALARRFAPEILSDADRCTTLATDGETFGHHHKGGDSALAEALAIVASLPGRRVLNAATLVAEYPATTRVSLVSPSAWSCAHGVERWRSNCGCRLDGSKAPAQQWRGPLRRALEQLAEPMHALFAQEGATLFRADPFDVRDAYGDVVGQDGAALDRFARDHVRDGASEQDVVRARELLELERASLRTFTSCAWFFDEVDRIEVRQVLRYAARCVELSGQGNRIMSELIKWLGEASSGHEHAVSAGDVFVRDALPHKGPALCVAASAMALAATGVSVDRIATFDIALRTERDTFVATLTHRRTGRAGHFVGRVTGTGPGVVVSIAPEGADARERDTVALWEFPESVARVLLRAGASADDALLGVI